MSIQVDGLETPYNNHADAYTAAQFILQQWNLNDEDREELRWKARELQSSRKDVNDNAGWVKSRAQSIQDGLNGLCFSPNSLGELQSAGPSLDVAIAVYCEKASQLEIFLKELMKKYEK